MEYVVSDATPAIHPLQDEVIKLLETGRIGDVLLSWFQRPDASIRMVPGINDDSGKPVHDAISLGFSRGGSDIFYVYIPLVEVQKQYPWLHPVSKFVSVQEDRDMMPGRVSLQLNQKPCDAMLGIKRDELYDDVLCGDVLNFEGAIMYALMFGICPYVDVSISDIDPELLLESDLTDWRLNGQRILCFSVMYQDPSAGEGYIPGFGDWVYAALPVCQ